MLGYALKVCFRPEHFAVSLLQECADAGWWMGEIGGRQGVFPDNFVKLLEAEKEVILWRGTRLFTAILEVSKM